MKYKFKCECGESTTKQSTPDDLDDLKETGVDCPECGETAEYVFSPEGVDVCFRGGGWRDKSLRERRYRQDRSKKMAVRQKNNHKVRELQPNFEGQRTESWREARSLAKKADGYFPETYDQKVENEES